MRKSAVRKEVRVTQMVLDVNALAAAISDEVESWVATSKIHDLARPGITLKPTIFRLLPAWLAECSKPVPTPKAKSKANR